ncbi:MAG: hypothetical protein AAGA96_15210 [Verrucomicrobiota bacterium]
MLSSFDERPTAQNAKLDRMRVNVEGWSLGYPNEYELNQFLTGLAPLTGVNPSRVPETTVMGGNPETAQWGWIFNQASRPPRTSKSILKVREKGALNYGRVPGYPLFGGRVEVLRRRTSGESGVAAVRGNLFLNPTRFAHHQHPFDSTDYRVWTPGIPRRRSQERSLDGNDNFLTGRLEERYSTPAEWNRLLRGYWRGVLNCVESEFTRSIQVAGNRVSKSGTLQANLRQAEVYWEVRSNDAPRDLAALMPSIVTIGRRASATHYRVERNVNCTSIIVDLRGGLFLRVYAKTEKRLRFELSYDLRERGIEGIQKSSRRTDFQRWCQIVSEDAASRMDGIFAHLRSASSGSGDLLQFLDEFYRSVGDVTLGRSILRVLARDGCITPTDRETKAAVAKLKRARVLQSAPTHGGPAIIHQNYRAAFDEAFPRSL